MLLRTIWKCNHVSAGRNLWPYVRVAFSRLDGVSVWFIWKSHNYAGLEFGRNHTFGESHLSDEEKIYVSGCMSFELAAPVGKSVISGGGSESKFAPPKLVLPPWACCLYELLCDWAQNSLLLSLLLLHLHLLLHVQYFGDQSLGMVSYEEKIQNCKWI